MEENTKSFWDNKNLEVTDEVLSMEESSMLYDIVSNEDKYAEEAPDIVTESDVYNIFGKLFGGDINYSGRLSNIIHCTKATMIDSMMKEFVDTSFKYANEKLTDENEKKKFISIIYNMSLVYSSASFIKDSYCHPLLEFYLNKMQNKMDKYCSEVRFKRCKDDFESFMNKTGFTFNSTAIVYSTMVIAMKYGYTLEENSNASKYIYVLLSQYAKTIKEDDYVSKWFVISFIANIARMAVLDENDIKAQPHLLDRQANLAKFIIFIWKHSSPETFVPPTTANTNIEETPNIVEENLPPIPEI